MKKLAVLHITNWFPHKRNPLEALWIKRHIDSLDSFCTNTSIHIDIRKGRIKFESKNQNSSHLSLFLWLPFRIFRVLEIVYTILLIYGLLRKKYWKYDLINFHIAYPMCTYIHILKKWIKKPFLINEHWSEYRNNFGISDQQKTRRIRNIFQHQIPLITVSNALYNDILKFSGFASFPHYILPNIVDNETSKPLNTKRPETPTFFMLSQWKFPKDPVKALHGFKNFFDSNPNAKLVIGGYGPQMKDIKSCVKKFELEKNVQILGPLTPLESSQYFLNSTAFIHCSSYETFSVVCAESLGYGCPVIASKVGGIMEYVNSTNGILLDHDKFELSLEKSLMKINSDDYNRLKIAESNNKSFSSSSVGKIYFNILNEVIENFGHE